MNEYKFRKTEEAAEAFSEAGVHFVYMQRPNSEALAAGFHIDNVPDLTAYFICRGEYTPVAFRIFDIVQNITKDRQSRVLEACNILNCTVRFLKYTLAEDDSVQVDYDIPCLSSGREMGDTAVGILAGTMSVLEEHYAFLMKAVYSDEPLALSDLDSGRQTEGELTLPAAHPDPGMLS